MKGCKFCNSHKVVKKKVLKSPVNGLYYSLYKCKVCKSCFFNSKEHPVNLHTMYNDFISRADFPMEFKPSKKWSEEKTRIFKYIKRKPRSVLDIGCRTGDFLMHFSSEAIRVGVELSDNFSEIAKKRGLRIYNDFLENIKFSETFDIVTCYAILEHLEKPLVFLNALAELVNKGGVLVIMIPAYQSLKPRLLNTIGKQWHMYSPPEHLNFYSIKFLDRYLNKKGFKKLSRRYSSGGMLLFKSGIIQMIEKYFAIIINKTFLSRFAIYDHMYIYYEKI